VPSGFLAFFGWSVIVSFATPWHGRNGSSKKKGRRWSLKNCSTFIGIKMRLKVWCSAAPQLSRSRITGVKRSDCGR
jgi:hypothetical protein